MNANASVHAARLAHALAQMLGEEAVISAPEALSAYAIDGVVPTVAAFPSTVDQVSDLLAFAHAEGLAVIPWGGGTLKALGNPPRRADILLSLARLNQVLEHEPADLTATAQAGITLEALQTHLAHAGQWLPLDPPLASRATIGGLLAANASGPQRLGYGTLRDLVIGLRVVGDDGVIFKSGAKVVKNAAGYDLPKLFIGSLGTLGIVVEVTFKLLPLPKARCTLIASFRTLAQASEAVRQVLASALTPTALEILDSNAARAVGLPGEGWTLCARFAGIPPATARQTREMERVAKSAGALTLSTMQNGAEAGLWSQIADLPATLPPADGAWFRAKIGVLPTRLPEAAEAVEQIAQAYALQTSLWLRAGTGLAYAVLQGGEPDGPGLMRLGLALSALRERAGALGGTMTVEEAPVALKVRDAVWGPPRSDFRVMQAIKRNFDPKGILNPGRFVGAL
jgi:glycolate oxidase FAD binding subunit